MTTERQTWWTAEYGGWRLPFSMVLREWSGQPTLYGTTGNDHILSIPRFVYLLVKVGLRRRRKAREVVTLPTAIAREKGTR